MDELMFSAVNNMFGFRTWKTLQGTSNLLISPFSLTSAMVMVMEGARNGTSEEMAKVLGVDQIISYRYEGIATAGKICSQLMSLPGSPIKVVNRLHIDEKWRVKKEFVKATLEAFGEAIENIDLQRAEEARININGLVALQTNGLIKNILPPGAITEDTKVVLSNAMYFMADWLYRFDTAATTEKYFRSSDTEAKFVPMMTQTRKIWYYRDPLHEVQVVELPYSPDLSMVIALPEKVGLDELSKLEAVCNPSLLDYWRKEVDTTQVCLSIPKFTLEAETLSLRDSLLALGIKQAFDIKTADFSGLAETEAEPICLDNIYHKGFLKVDENGTEAAAASTAVMTTRGFSEAPMNEIAFTANHPFLFWIVDLSTSTILFMGRVVHP